MEDIFNLIQIGQEEEFKHKITEKDIDKFCDLTGDDNPLHMDTSYAQETDFKDRVVHGMLSASFISTMIGTRLPGKGSLWYEQHIKFLVPVRIGDEIRIWAKVLHKSESQRIIVLQTMIYNQLGKTVIEGEAKVKVLKKNKKEKVKNHIENMESLKGAVIISGASGGIGAATAIKLAMKGYAIIVNYYNNEKRASEVVDQIKEFGGRAIHIKANIANNEEVKSMVSVALNKFGTIDGLVNNASAPISYRSFDEITWNDFQVHLDVQIKGALNLCKSIIPHFIENKKGSIVNISSIYADNVPPAKMMHYSLSKSALISFTRSLAVEHGPLGIRVNCVSPGMTNTDMIADIPDKAKMVSKMTTPLRQLAQPEDVANTVSFLISADSKHITGETIRVCGGQIMI
ncbi:MAG: 3-oxoacyl-[acyl-carrier protein] reductase [bacterium]|jgi:3-oxoacyl-[acyl-carrier protein] reductase